MAGSSTVYPSGLRLTVAVSGGIWKRSTAGRRIRISTGMMWRCSATRDEYQLGIREIQPESIREIDSFEELCQLDPSYCEKEKA